MTGNSTGLHIFLKSLLRHKCFVAARPYIKADYLPREARLIFGMLEQYYQENPESDVTAAGLTMLSRNDAAMGLLITTILASQEAGLEEVVHLAKALAKKYHVLELARHLSIEDPANINWDIVAHKLYKEVILDSLNNPEVCAYDSMPDVPSITAVWSGFKSIDSLLPFPFPKGGVHMFGGRIKDGKTTFLNNMTLAMLIKGHTGLYVCREMSPAHMGLKIEAIAFNKAEAEVMKEKKHYSGLLAKALKNKGSMLYYMNGQSTSSAQLENVLDKLTKDGVKLDFIVDDYLMLMVVGNRSESRFEHDLRSREAKRLAEKYNVAYITAWQLAEDTPSYPRYRDDYNVKVSDWAESKTLVGSHPHSLWGLWSNKDTGTLRLNLIAHRDYSYPFAWVYTINRESGKILGEY